MKKADLDKFDNSWYKPEKKLKVIFWYFTNIFLFNTALPISSRMKVKVLRIFGSKLGSDVVIKPNVSIKYPWFLSIGNNCWIGENVWIDNLDLVSIGNNVCLSQGCYLLTGGHDYKKETFDLMLREIVLEDGVWVGAKAIVCPGVTCRSHSVLTAGSIATKDLEEYGVFQGNPAIWKRSRKIV